MPSPLSALTSSTPLLTIVPPVYELAPERRYVWSLEPVPRSTSSEPEMAPEIVLVLKVVLLPSSTRVIVPDVAVVEILPLKLSCDPALLEALLMVYEPDPFVPAVSTRLLLNVSTDAVVPDEPMVMLPPLVRKRELPVKVKDAAVFENPIFSILCVEESILIVAEFPTVALKDAVSVLVPVVVEVEPGAALVPPQLPTALQASVAPPPLHVWFAAWALTPEAKAITTAAEKTRFK